MPKQLENALIHIPFFIVGIVIAAVGFAGIGDYIKEPHIAFGTSWQSTALVVLFGGMILGASAYSLFVDLTKENRK